MSRQRETLDLTNEASSGVDAPEGTPSLLDELVSTSPVEPPRPAGPYVGDVMQARSPAAPGRARVRFRDEGGASREEWLITLASIAVRPGDRVLLVVPVGWSEPLVTGVIDGASTRPPATPRPGASLSLEPDESVRITAVDGTPLLEVFQAETGPVVRLCQPDVHLELPGSLRVDARSIELSAKQGGVAVKATDAVVVEGETIRLN